MGYIVMGGKESDMTEHERSAHGQRARAHCEAVTANAMTGSLD